jgi:hypothetical protein
MGQRVTIMDGHFIVTGNASATPGAAVTLVGSVRNLPANSGLVVVEAEIAVGESKANSYLPTMLEDIPVASRPVTRGGSRFAVAVPNSSVLRRA